MVLWRWGRTTASLRLPVNGMWAGAVEGGANVYLVGVVGPIRRWGLVVVVGERCWRMMPSGQCVGRM